MPIKLGFEAKPISYEDFHSLDYQIMGIVFSIHRDLGRFWKEKIYQTELAYRCQQAGFENVATEVPIHVSYKNFIKVYYIDLLINNVIYELKTAQTLTGEHEKQTINYLMLTGMNHAKLINMRPASVQHRFISTNITPQRRYNFSIDDKQWCDVNKQSTWLKQVFHELLNEWGVFLDITLFYDAVVHFRGDEDVVVHEIEVKNGLRVLGRQKTHLIAREVAFHISSVTKNEEYYENHLRRFIRYTSLKAIQWINFNYDRVVFKTVLR